MIAINLLSPIVKKRLTELKRYLILKRILFIASYLLIILSVVIFFSHRILKNYSDVLTQQLNNEQLLVKQGKVTALEDTISELNRQLALANEIQSKYIRWTPFLSQLNSIIPDGIKFESLEINSETNTFKIVGRAKEREALLTFQRSLKDFPFFINLNSPVSNLAQREDISFEISGQLTSTIYE